VGVLEFVVALLLGFLVLTGWIMLMVHLVHMMRHKYRLEREADDRRHKKEMAEDFAENTRLLASGMTFDDYIGAGKQQAGKQKEK
jgi:hypothetical protein